LPVPDRNVFARRDVETALEQRQVVIEIEPNAKIGKLTGEKVVAAAHGLEAIAARDKNVNAIYLQRSVEHFNPA
jgi:hypothetical protein